MSTLKSVEPKIVTLTTWHDHLVAWRAELSERLSTCDASTKHAIELSIRRIDYGLDFMNQAYPANLPLDDLMRDAGHIPCDAFARASGDQWFGTLPVVTQRLQELIAKRDEAQRMLDHVLL
jgi:hypothetical protein